jgi:hypothetical protein
MSDYDAFGKALSFLFWVSVVSVPFGLWKVIEIIIWLFTHVHISW